MIIAVTGTPGVGKTTVSKILAERLGYEYVSVKDFAVEKGIGEKSGDELEIDVDELAERMSEEFRGRNVVIDGHLSHFVPADIVVVLRAHPKLVAERLKERGYSRKKLAENVEAELIDVILVEALEENETVIEVDTTGKTPEEVADEITDLIGRGVKKRVGIVDWSDAYDEVLPYLNLS
ncbi:AAA family ATPase [Thermococcus sp. M36]|uniref:adenylate kinase family protein n=1 Tax=Thermococcus sp. M36 TaxID=1638261 RepID=UPI00143B46C2|nr:adenylate kinase family protein [Thermococcus sp. M36]NJE06152.1 AAA family ATPase [Thermococcus sp. M36]